VDAAEKAGDVAQGRDARRSAAAQAPTGSDGVRQDVPAGAANLRFRSRAVARIPSVGSRIAVFAESRVLAAAPGAEPSLVSRR
jgi:hypothetical protein